MKIGQGEKQAKRGVCLKVRLPDRQERELYLGTPVVEVMAFPHLHAL